MAKYEVRVKIETEEDCSDGEQIERLRGDIETAIVNSDCFYQVGLVKIRELES